MKQNYAISRHLFVLMIVGFITVLHLPAAASQTARVPMVPQNFTGLVDTVSPAVVHIRVEKTVEAGGQASGPFSKHPFGGDQGSKDFFGHRSGPRQRPEFKRPGQGSGFIIDKAGIIVTNNHVVEGADKIKVILKDETSYDAEIVGRDPATDIAVIKVEAKVELPFVTMGSSESLKVGEWVTAIGSPFGLEYTVTAGIVSAKGRVIGSGPYDDFIQTDASINPGNSGGPLINMKGEVVGINTMIISGGQGIGFAIPVDLARGVIAQLRTSGEVTRGWLGVTVQDLKEELADYYGVKDRKGALVASVVPGDPADAAGVRPMDIITEVNGEKVETSKDLITLAAGLTVGDTVQVTVWRNGEPKSLNVEIGKRPLTVASASQDRRQEKEGEYGFQVTELTPEIARRLNIDQTSGVIVVGVEPDSKADSAGMKQGDLILEVNRQAVASVNEMKKLIDGQKQGNGVSLLIKRMNAGLKVIHLV